MQGGTTRQAAPMAGEGWPAAGREGGGGPRRHSRRVATAHARPAAAGYCCLCPCCCCAAARSRVKAQETPEGVGRTAEQAGAARRAPEGSFDLRPLVPVLDSFRPADAWLTTVGARPKRAAPRHRPVDRTMICATQGGGSAAGAGSAGTPGARPPHPFVQLATECPSKRSSK